MAGEGGGRESRVAALRRALEVTVAHLCGRLFIFRLRPSLVRGGGTQSTPLQESLTRHSPATLHEMRISGGGFPPPAGEIHECGQGSYARGNMQLYVRDKGVRNRPRNGSTRPQHSALFAGSQPASRDAGLNCPRGVGHRQLRVLLPRCH